jgi:hypothetical protein
LVTTGPDTLAGAPDTYDPGNGGAAYNEHTDTLTVTSQSGAVLFTLPKASSHAPVKRLLGRELQMQLGVLVCGWSSTAG